MPTERDYQVTHEGEVYYVRLFEDGEVITISDKDKNPVDLDDDVKETISNKAVEMYEEEEGEDLEDEEENEEENEVEAE